jgi:2-amino-4-hydroxy-6-hydroxymethyldihydropteridine diphosphokinase
MMGVDVEGYVALGSNLGNRETFLLAGLKGLARRDLPPHALSSVYETEPVGSREPLWFLNMVVCIRTPLAPLDVLDRLLDVEAEIGRRRTVRNAPRELDLDLLLLGDYCFRGPHLMLPHPRMWVRRFVLEPLSEIAPALRDPRSGHTVEEILSGLGDSHAVRRLGPLATLQAGTI